MKYPSGKEAQLGDVVRVGESDEGHVVCSIDSDEFSYRFPNTEWGYLRQGILVEFERFGLVHYRQPEHGMVLLSRIASLGSQARGRPGACDSTNLTSMTLRQKQIRLRRLNQVAFGLCCLGLLSILILLLAGARWKGTFTVGLTTAISFLVTELVRRISIRVLLRWRRAPREYRQQVAERLFWMGALGGLITIVELTESDTPLDRPATSPTSPSSPQGTTPSV